MRIAIAGGSAAGLFAALLLARAGHDVVVLERDRLEPAADVESAASVAFRPSAPQIVQPHLIMARCRQLLIERLPDVYAGMLAAGVAEAPLRTQMPDTLADTASRPGDEELMPVMTRRSTVDWVLGRAAAAEPRVEVRYGVKVAGLLSAPGTAQVPHVTGLRTDQGDLPADLVVDGTPVATGLLAIGDSVCTTNPTLGRGLALALTGAADLADTLAEYGDNPAAQALAMDRLVAAHVAPFYQDQAAIDAARLAMMRHTIFGEPAPRPPAVADRVSYPQLRVAGCYDPVAFRAFWTINGMVRPPDEVYTDPQVVACTWKALGRHGSGPPVAQPTRAQLLAALAA